MTLSERKFYLLILFLSFLLKSSLCSIALHFHFPHMNNWGLCSQTHHYGCLRVGRLSSAHLWRPARTVQWDAQQGFHAFKCSVLGDCDCRAVTAGCFWGALSFCRTVSASNGWEPSTVMWHQGCQAVFAERQWCWCDPVLLKSNYAILKLQCFFSAVCITLWKSVSILVISGLSLRNFARPKSTNQVLCDVLFKPLCFLFDFFGH